MKLYLVAIGLVLSLQSATSFAENYDQQSPQIVLKMRQQIEKEFAGTEEAFAINNRSQERSVLRNYEHLDPKHWVPEDLLKTAVLFYDKNKTKFSNKKFMTIVDFNPRSDKHRFYLLDMQSGQVERYRTTHGEGSDYNNDGYADDFGNIPNSKKSSLGFARTAEVYYGKFGRSLRLDGLSSSNSKIRQRAIVFHGWAPVKEAPQLQPLSWGCITMDLAFRDRVLDKIKEGSLMYVGLSR